MSVPAAKLTAWNMPLVHRITVLISGNGSNLQALIDARGCGRLDLASMHVISNKAAAFGLERARKAGIPHSILAHEEFADREGFDRALADLIATQTPDLVILAGFMRILGPSVLRRFSGRLINLHPSLLPLYRGVDTYARAIRDGAVEHGASMHFVTAELDGGPVISQVRIPVRKSDDPRSLAVRLAPREHELVVATTELFTRYPVQCGNGQIFVDGKALEHPLLLQSDGTFAF
jgi:phosphoribosylglycinamide formyltransferase-1